MKNATLEFSGPVTSLRVVKFHFLHSLHALCSVASGQEAGREGHCFCPGLWVSHNETSVLGVIVKKKKKKDFNNKNMGI